MCIIHTLTCLKKFVHLHLSKYYVITAKKRLRICRDMCDETTHNYECKASITLVLALLCYNELIYISDDIKMCLISLWENIKTTHLAIEFFSFNKYLFSYLYKVL